MKARVKATGEIVDGKAMVSFHGDDFYLDELEFLDNNPDYWTRLEHQYAGMAMQGIEVEFSNFFSLVKRMREAQDAFNISVSADNIEDIDFWHIRMLELEREVDEYLKKMDI
jgi:hypothetical protein